MALSEDGTMLDLGELNAGGDAANDPVALGSLFDGSNAPIEETFIADVLETLSAELVLLKANIDIGAEDPNADSIDGHAKMPGKVPTWHLQFSDWEDAALGATPDWDDTQDYKKERADAITAVEEAIAALDSQEAFMAALGDEAVFSAVDDDYDATNYGAVKASADISFSSTANTRFGIVSTTERANVDGDIRQQFLQIFLESPGCSYFSTASGKNDSHVLGANDCLDGLSRGQRRGA